jgi:hypothetical protein
VSQLLTFLSIKLVGHWFFCFSRNGSIRLKSNNWGLPLCYIEIIFCDIAFIEVNGVRTHFNTFSDNWTSPRPQLSGYGHRVLTLAARDSHLPSRGAPSWAQWRCLEMEQPLELSTVVADHMSVFSGIV